MRIVILGAGGLLGRHLAAELRGGTDEVVALPRAECDIAVYDAVLEATRGADRVVNAAAYTDVDGAEGDETAAYRANALGTENVARAAERHGIPLLHVSTDFVFDGEKKTPYDELDAPAPRGIYARSKWAGEELAKAACTRLFLVRVQALYGDGGRNFASRIRALLLENKRFTVDAEREAQPTWVRTAAQRLLTIVRSDAYGTYHVSTRGSTTWAGFAARIAATLGADPAFTPVPTAALATKARRPERSLFHHRMLELRGMGAMPAWEDDLAAYMSSHEARR